VLLRTVRVAPKGRYSTQIVKAFCLSLEVMQSFPYSHAFKIMPLCLLVSAQIKPQISQVVQSYSHAVSVFKFGTYLQTLLKKTLRFFDPAEAKTK
jgi:hypothetical protein